MVVVVFAQDCTPVLQMECSSTGVSSFLCSVFLLFFLLFPTFTFKTRTTRPDTVVSADPKNQCHFLCSTSQTLAQQSQTLFLSRRAKVDQKKGTRGWRKHCGFLFSNLYMWKDLKFILTDVWYLNHLSVSYLWHCGSMPFPQGFVQCLRFHEILQTLLV